MVNILQDGEYEIGGITFGTRDLKNNPNPYLVQAFEVTPGALITGVGGNLLSSGTSSSGSNSADASYPNEDGTKFGQDYYTGMLITLSMSVWQRDQIVLDQIGALQGEWRSKAYRYTSNAVSQMRICRGGRTRIVYGRPRNFKATYGETEQGWAPITATFQCADENFYDDAVKSQNIGMVNAPVDGLTLPTTIPFRIAQFRDNYTTIRVNGNGPTWPMLTVYGPVTNPTITYDDDWTITLLVTLDHTETLTIDPRPWQRRTLKRSVAITNLSGNYTQDSPTMRQMMFYPGQHTIAFGGVDDTLSSYLNVSWRDAYATP